MATETIVYAILAALIYSVVFFGKHHFKDKPESLDITKLGATAIIGAILGIIFYVGDLSMTAEAIETQLVAYAGMVALVESILKTVYRAIKK